MPYSLVQVIAKQKGSNNRWNLNIDPTTLVTTTVNDLILQYVKIHLVLSHTSLVEPQTFNLTANINLIGNKNVTLQNWLVSLGNTALPTTNFIGVSLTKSKVIYGDAWESGFKPTLVTPTGNPSNPALPSEQTSLLLTKPDIDYLQMANRCLAVVNGMVMPLEGSVHGCYIHNALTSLKLANDNKVGLLSFDKVGDIKVYPITAAMLDDAEQSLDTFSGATLYTDLRLKVPEDLTNKTVLMIIGGYLHVADPTYHVTGTDIVNVHMRKITLPERIYESRTLRSFASLQTATIMQDTFNFGISNTALYSNATIKKYLLDNSSYIVVVDKDDLVVERKWVYNERLAGVYSLQSATRPNLPLINGYGKLVNYVARKYPNKWALNCSDATTKLWRWQSTQRHELGYVDDALDTITPLVNRPGYFLEISNETLVGLS